MRTRYLYLPLAACFSAGSHGQVLTDFEDGEVAQWLVEADGVPSLSATGNPGNCLRVNDAAAGAINEVVLPWAYVGDWSAATSLDSIAFDLYPHEISGSFLGAVGLPLVTIMGPGGEARVLIDHLPVFDTWQHIALPLDSAAWIVTGSWTELMQEVQVVKVRSEFIDGDEWSLLDNVLLTFSPAFEELNGSICSTWDSAGVYDGWSFQNVSSIEVSMTQGNPPGSVRLTDAANELTYAVAAPKFRGDWSALNDVAGMTFDLYLQTSSTDYFEKEYLVQLSGAGGVARYHGTDSLTALTTNQWHSYAIPISSSSWELVSGTWEELMDFVGEIRLELEFIQGTGETTYIDNFCLDTGLPTLVPQHSATNAAWIYPNPSNGDLSIRSAIPAGLDRVSVLNALGQVVADLRPAGTDRVELDLRTGPAGCYVVRVEQGGRITSLPLIVQR